MSNGTANYTIEINQGSDIIIPFLLEDSKGNKQDLSGYKVKMQIRASSYSETTLDDLSTENKRIVIKEAPESTLNKDTEASPKCVIECIWTNEITSKFPAGIHVYDIEIISGDHHVTRILEGKFKVSREISR